MRRRPAHRRRTGTPDTSEPKSRSETAVAPGSIAGISPAAILHFLLRSAEQDFWTPEYLAKALGLNAATARDVLGALEAFGYAEPAPEKRAAWRNTAAGNALAGVSKAKPVARRTLEKGLEEFVNRIYRVNGDPAFAYRVKKAVLFGPLLNTDLDRLRQADVAVEIAPKEADRPAAASPALAARGRRAGDEVRRFLKGRGRAIALHELEDWIVREPHRILYPIES